jgi:hypothetical protein
MFLKYLKAKNKKKSNIFKTRIENTNIFMRILKHVPLVSRIQIIFVPEEG